MVFPPLDLWLDRAARLSLEKAAREGMVPVRWWWGPDTRAAHSAWLDSEEAKMLLIVDDSLALPDDGRICEYLGLPAFPMVAEGIALVTVKEQ